ncbi:hypothetical protein ElyMa_006839300 [Elysia marginata]|uniref:BESS domain-containing protein n=1 Tax=Elysia marginata TaxID=1093978 RepID=A0AAV4JBW3_9GAST|nr:hypothetical protein ElyMa_006839300 [Elysia marginata]
MATKHSSRKRHSPYPQKRASTFASPFDAAMLDAFKILQQQQQQQQQIQHQIKDDDEQFLMSLLPVMKTLEPVTKFEFRGELNNTALRYLRLSQQPRYPNFASTTPTTTATATSTYHYSHYASSPS